MNEVSNASMKFKIVHLGLWQAVLMRIKSALYIKQGFQDDCCKKWSYLPVQRLLSKFSKFWKFSVMSLTCPDDAVDHSMHDAARTKFWK